MNKHLWKAYRFFQAGQASLLLVDQTTNVELQKDHLADSIISEILMEEELEKYRSQSNDRL